MAKFRNTSYTLIRFFHFLLLIGCLGWASAATKTNVDFYVKWEGLSTDEILSKAKNYLLQGNDNGIDSATVCLTIASSRLKSDLKSTESQKQYIYALSKLGGIYLSSYYDYSKAYAHLIEAQEVAENTSNLEDTPSIYLNLGILFVHNYVLTKDNQALAEGQDYLLKAFFAGIKQEKYSTALIAINNLLTLSMFYGNFDSMKEAIDAFESLNVPQEYDQRYAHAQMLLKASRYYADKDYEQALQYFDSLVDDSISNYDDARHYIMINNHRMHMLDAMNRRAQTLPLLLQNEKLATEYGIKDVLFHTYQDLAELYRENGNDALADQYTIKYFQEKDSMSANNELGNIYEMKFRYDLEKSTQALETAMQRQREQRIIIWAIVAIVIFMAIMFAVKIKDNRQLKHNYQILYQKSLESLANEEARPKYQTSGLTDNDKAQIAQRVQDVLDNNPEIYSIDFNMNRLAELADAPARSISQVLNEVYGKNFNNILTECRIREACRRLQQPDAKSRYTIEVLSESVGFKSRTNFAANFKALTGLTPSQYIKLSKQ